MGSAIVAHFAIVRDALVSHRNLHRPSRSVETPVSADEEVEVICRATDLNDFIVQAIIPRSCSNPERLNGRQFL